MKICNDADAIIWETCNGKKQPAERLWSFSSLSLSMCLCQSLLALISRSVQRWCLTQHGWVMLAAEGNTETMCASLGWLRVVSCITCTQWGHSPQERGLGSRSVLKYENNHDPHIAWEVFSNTSAATISCLINQSVDRQKIYWQQNNHVSILRKNARNLLLPASQIQSFCVSNIKANWNFGFLIGQARHLKTSSWTMRKQPFFLTFYRQNN